MPSAGDPNASPDGPIEITVSEKALPGATQSDEVFQPGDLYRHVPVLDAQFAEDIP